VFLQVVSLSLIALLIQQIYSYNPVARAATNATLALSPSNTSVPLNQNFTVDILLNTGGGPVDGVDIYSLDFNPAVLQVVDSNAGVAGIQIAPGALFPNTVINTVDNITGTVQFSQSSSGGSNFTGSGTLATITFRGAGGGTSAATFDFILNSTADTNVAYQGIDQLGSVTNGSFTVDTSAPTVSITAPSAGATVSGATTTVSATAADNVGVVGVQFKLDGANLSSEDISAPYSIVWNTTTTTNASHSLTATARDAAGNTTTSSAISVTVNNADATPPTVSITAPSGGSTVSGAATTVSATAADNVGVAGVQFKLDGVNLGAEDTTSPYSVSWNTTTATNTTHSLTAVARDAAGNNTTSSAVSVTVNNAFQRTISIPSLEARTSLGISGTLDVLSSPAKTLLKSYPFTTNASGGATISFDIAAQTVFLKTKVTPFLTRLLTQDLNTNVTYTFPQLLTGDINQDNIINSIDYSVLNTNWFTSNASADLNLDGLVNSIDYSFMNKHWLVTGEQ